MVKLTDVLGMNARNHLYQSRYNSRRGKKIADSKLLTKSCLGKAKLAVPKLYRVFRSEKAVEKYDFSRLPEQFVVKPSHGLGGEGIMVVEGGGTYAGEWVTVDQKTVTIQDLKLHIKDILSGRFSFYNLPDQAFVEERVLVHPRFEPIAFQGTPDIGILIFNRVPVMAFLRLPSKESHGKANMFQGAIACGVDMATGVTTKAIKHTQEIKFFPGTRRKLAGIKIPRWDEVLELALKAAEAVKLGYCRVDIVLQPRRTKKGKLKSIPMVLEVNAQPGLKIQLANEAGLRRRLERVEGLKVKTEKQGIAIGKALFSARDEAESIQGGVLHTGVFEDVEVETFLGEKQSVKAKIDTGAFRTSIDENLAKQLGLLDPENVLWKVGYRSALGREERKVVGITFYLKGKKIKTSASVSDRSKLNRPMIIGRRDLLGIAVRVREREAGQEA
jgi:alpha-L-glutamate ligase-like protein